MWAMFTSTTRRAIRPSSAIDEVKLRASSLCFLSLGPRMSIFPVFLNLRTQSRGDPRLEPPQLDEPHGALLVELGPAAVGREPDVVDRVLRRPPHDPGGPLVELHPDRAGDPVLGRRDEPVQRRAQGLEPEPRVNEPGPLPLHLGLEVELVAGEHQLLQVPVGFKDHRGGGALVDFAGFYPHQPVFYVVYPPHAALSIVYSTGKPVIFLGVGQGYDDLVPFDSQKFLGSLL
ncbi:MAG: hypothetical protein JRN51_09900 [Nitrososphaerota archaeon]|nr:hypothetical protein [Nitrososphaerota archaeon]